VGPAAAVVVAAADVVVVVLLIVVVVFGAVDVEKVVACVVVDVAAFELDEGEEPPELPPGPETDVVIEPFSIYTPEKYQSSTSGELSAELPGSLRTPKCQSSPLDEVLAEIGATTWTRSSEPVECQKPTVLAEKSISYATLCHVSVSRVALQCVTWLTIHFNVGSDVPEAPLKRPYFISVKWLSKKLTWCSRAVLGAFVLDLFREKW